MQEVKYIQKRGHNKFHNYKYATESDVSEKVREELAARNIMMIPNVVSHSNREHINAKGKTEYIATIMMEFRFIDGDSGEEITFHSIGEGQDAGDKAVYKAITGAQKYALMKAFMIPTGDDPEADTGTDERNSESIDSKQRETSQSENVPITAEQVGIIKTKAMEFAKARNQSVEAVYKVLKIDDVTRLNMVQADAVIEQLMIWIQNVNKKGNKGA
ncbi:ERF family protein [Bacillus sp. FJAT-49732]|uniref:ERF family protein n=2 Tax=Lederbergia citrisecunda TaxID=2833583 RepID=A0A942TLA3_9BACI|nr:ERF family protein [Lederbergia citrisecunda]